MAVGTPESRPCVVEAEPVGQLALLHGVAGDALLVGLEQVAVVGADLGGGQLDVLDRLLVVAAVNELGLVGERPVPAVGSGARRQKQHEADSHDESVLQHPCQVTKNSLGYSSAD